MKKRLCALLLAGLMILTTFPSASADYEDIDGDGKWTLLDEILTERESQDELPSWYDSSMDDDSGYYGGYDDSGDYKGYEEPDYSRDYGGYDDSGYYGGYDDSGDYKGYEEPPYPPDYGGYDDSGDYKGYEEPDYSRDYGGYDDSGYYGGYDDSGDYKGYEETPYPRDYGGYDDSGDYKGYEEPVSPDYKDYERPDSQNWYDDLDINHDGIIDLKDARESVSEEQREAILARIAGLDKEEWQPENPLVDTKPDEPLDNTESKDADNAPDSLWDVGFTDIAEGGDVVAPDGSVFKVVSRDVVTDGDGGQYVTTTLMDDNGEMHTRSDYIPAPTPVEPVTDDVKTEDVIPGIEDTYFYNDDGTYEDKELQALLEKERLEAVKDAESARQALYDLMASMNELMEARAKESMETNLDDNGNTLTEPEPSVDWSDDEALFPPSTTEPEPSDDVWEWESSDADDLMALYTETVTAQAATEYVESADVVIDLRTVNKLARIADSVNAGEESAVINNKAENADASVSPLHDSRTANEIDNFSLSAVISSEIRKGSNDSSLKKTASANFVVRRKVSKTVTFSADKTDITIRIETDVKHATTADKIQVKTPAYAITFTIADLAPDLNEALIIRCRDAGTMDAESGGSKIVEVDLPGGKLANPFTVSMPAIDGNVTYQTLASVQGASEYSGNARNGVTDDYRLNHDVDFMAGSKTKAIPSKENPATKNMDGRTAESGRYTNINNPKDFTDIANKSAEMQNAIRYLASKGIINGTSESTFSPDNPITRAHIVALIMRGLGKVDNSLQAHFKDVPSNAWYYHELASSEKLNIINGFSDGTFRGNNTINKAQITTVAGRILVSEMKYTAPEGTEKNRHLKKYKDEVPGYAQDMVALATREDVVVYRKDGTFSGGSLMTRGDAAILLYRLFKRIWY